MLNIHGIREDNDAIPMESTECSADILWSDGLRDAFVI
jgi:hypothetical protein